MVRNVDYESRRRAVLTTTINRYIKDASPVSSDVLSDDFELSSATIRNIFAGLEDDGYLTHPYTSGGRIPTHKGYRYYVDFLISQMELLDAEKEQIIQEYKRQITRMEDALEKTSEVISAITNYTGIVSFMEWQDKFFYRGIGHILEQPEFQDLDKMREFIRILEEKENLLNIINRDFAEKVKVYIGDELGCSQMQDCSLVVSVFKVKNKQGRLAVIGPARMEYRHIISTLDYLSGVLSQVLETI